MSRRNTVLFGVALIAAALFVRQMHVRVSNAASPEGAAQPAFSEPSASPDGAEIAFVSGGDIWTVPAAGGEARLLISHPVTESRPLYSPDGKRLAFVSTRTGNGDIYVLTFATGELRRLTYDDTPEQLNAWSADSRWLYCSTTAHDISNMNDVYRVSAEGGTPMAVAADRYANEFFAAPGPDGKTLAITARGTASSQWWRHGHSHLDESEIWLVRDTVPPVYERVTEGGAKELWPMWSRDAKTLYYVSDRSGAENIWARPFGGAARQVTQFKNGRVLWPAISADGRTIVFERNFGIWRLDTASEKAAEVPITRRGTPAGPGTEHLTLTTGFEDLALSPDGQKIAFTAHGEVFAASAKDGGEAQRITFTPAKEDQVTWAPDSRRLVYVSDRDGAPHLFLYDFATGTETQLTRSNMADYAPRFSPDGKLLAFERDGRELHVLDLESKEERLLTAGRFDRPPFNAPRPFAWSPDGKWIAYLPVEEKGFRNVWVVPAAGGEAKPASFLSNVFSGAVTWSPDGMYLLFDTRQRTENGQVARVDLVPRAPHFREDPFRDLFREQPRIPAGESRSSDSASEVKKPAPKPVEIVWEGIRRRTSLVPIGIDAGTATISPDGKWLLMIASAAGQFNLYVYSLDELAREPAVARQLTSTAGFKSSAQFTPDSKEVYYLERGQVYVVPLETRQPRGLSVTAELDVDFSREKLEVFQQAWSYLRDLFFDPNYNGADWNGLRAEFAPRITGAATQDEVRRLISLMLGELNASHLGISLPQSSQANNTGRIGLAFDRGEYESAGRLRIASVVPLGPAALAGGVHAGDYLLAVDGTPIGARTNLDALLDHKINRRVVLSVAASAEGAERHEVVVRPVSSLAEKNLLYREWVEERRAYVEKASGGRLGYVHMADMSATSLERLHLDLDTENRSRQGVVIDIRNNNGGFVNVYAIDVLARRGYLHMTPRGLTTAPARTMLGQRALELPTILVTNQHSLSDAEDFTEGYRTLGLGKVVGEPTAGWIIYTSGVQLIDGSNLRLPDTLISAADGSPMEMHPRPVDIGVTRPVGESYSGRDVQLDAAVRELLQQIGSRRR